MIGSVPTTVSFPQITSKSAWVIVLTVAFSSGCLSAKPKVDPNALFKVGDCRDIKIMVPKEGFVGAPPSGRAGPDHNVKTPTSEKDFRIKYARVTVLEVKKLKSSIRIAFSLDEIDQKGGPIMYPGSSREDSPHHEPLYYAYLFIRADRVRMTKMQAPLHTDERNDRWEPKESHFDRPGGSRVRDIQFPLTFTWPPALSPHESMKDNSGMFDDIIVLYDELTSLPERNAVKAGVTYMEKLNTYRDPNGPNALYYSPSEKNFGKEKKADSIPVGFFTKETQIWSNSNDWLWQEMERTDARGHVTMRCRRVP